MTDGFMALSYAAIYFFSSAEFKIMAILLTLILLTIKLFRLNKNYPLEKLRTRFLYQVVILFNVLLLATIFEAVSLVYAQVSLVATSLYFLVALMLAYYIFKRRKMTAQKFFN